MITCCGSSPTRRKTTGFALSISFALSQSTCSLVLYHHGAARHHWGQFPGRQFFREHNVLSLGQDASLGIPSCGRRALPRRRLKQNHRKSGIRLQCERILGLGSEFALICPRYYMISLMLGTVGLAYGSVPLYKMVCIAASFPQFLLPGHG